MFNWLDKIAQQIYAEKRYELEKAIGEKNPGRFLCRARTCDAAGAVFTYRMGAGYPGDVNRSHPVSIEPCLIDVNAPPTAYGQAVLVDATTQGVRPLATTDTGLTDVYGVTVRPFPMQQNSVNPAFGSGVPPLSGVVDVMKTGYIVVVLGNGNLTGGLKGGTVYIDIVASTGNHVLGNFEAAAGGTQLTMSNRWAFNGVQDANGYVELSRQ